MALGIFRKTFFYTYMNDTTTLTLASDLEEIDRVTTFVHNITSRIGCDNETEHRIMLALSEAITNAILHGNRQDPAKSVEVTAQVDSDSLLLTVRDEGKGFNPESIPDPRKEENLHKTSGRGVWLMKEFADEVHFSDNGSCVAIRFNMKS